MLNNWHQSVTSVADYGVFQLIIWWKDSKGDNLVSIVDTEMKWEVTCTHWCSTSETLLSSTQFIWIRMNAQTHQVLFEAKFFLVLMIHLYKLLWVGKIIHINIHCSELSSVSDVEHQRVHDCVTSHFISVSPSIHEYSNTKNHAPCFNFIRVSFMFEYWLFDWLRWAWMARLVFSYCH